ncbi:MAG: hypothetical protein O3B91_08070, partial [Actinomycetota bacterium]|nr:hypothetical protein [Actinomycetota bacterium]
MGSTWGMQGPTTWSELEGRLSGRKPQSSSQSSSAHSSPPVVRLARDPLVTPEPDRTPTGGT